MIAVTANAARREYRKKLADETTEEHQLRLREPLEDADDDTLRRLWVQGHLMERAAQIQLNSLEEREVVTEPEGDLVPAIVRDEHDEAVKAAENDRVKHLIEAIAASQRELEEEATAIPHEELLTNAMPAHIETLAQGVWNDVYTAALISRCTFTDKDHRKPAFKALSQVEKLKSQKPAIFRALANTHRGLLLELEPTLGF